MSPKQADETGSNILKTSVLSSTGIDRTLNGFVGASPELLWHSVSVSGSDIEVAIDEPSWPRTATTAASIERLSMTADGFVCTGKTMLDTLFISVGGFEMMASGGWAQTASFRAGTGVSFGAIWWTKVARRLLTDHTDIVALVMWLRRRHAFDALCKWCDALVLSNFLRKFEMRRSHVGDP